MSTAGSPPPSTSSPRSVSPPPSEIKSDSLAKAANRWIEDGEARDHVRMQATKDVLHNVLVRVLKWGFYLAFFVICGLALVWWLHLILPEPWLWLNEAKQKELRSTLFGGVFGALVSNYGRRYLF